MWPKLLDMTRDECKRVLRRIELEAYASIISAFRAQGDLNKEKKRLLQDLQHMLSISTERHRAEVRRAVNDEKLSTIADHISGTSNTSSEWVVEGRRLIPLMPRLVPQTAFTATANQAANLQAEKNASLPPPSATGNRDTNMTPIPLPPPPPVPKVSRPSSPTSNVVVLPSGASIHIKGMLADEEEELQSRRRRSRSLSTESQSSSVGTQTAQGPSYRPPPTGPSPLPSISPVKITISKSPQGRALVSQSGSQPPKVILVTSSGHSVTPSVLQRSVSVPIVRATTSTTTGATPRPSIVVPSTNPPNQPQTMSAFSSVTPSSGSVVASSPQPASIVTTPTYVGTPSSPIVNPTMLKPRTKLIPRQRFTQPQPKPGVVIPSGPQPVAPSPQTVGIGGAGAFGGKGKPTIQIKQEGGMRIITQSLPAGTSKILPKPTHLPGTSTPVVVVNAGPSGSPSGGKVLNITPGGRVIATSKASNVVTVNPKTLHLTAVKTAAGTTVSKPNVIVVQKTQPRRSQTPTTGTVGNKPATIITSAAGLEKELVHIFQAKDAGRQMAVTVATVPSSSSSSTVVARSQERKVIITTASAAGETLRQSIPILQRSKSDEAKTSSLLAELIQAAGIMPESTMEASGSGGSEWFEYEMEDGQSALATGEAGEHVAVTTVTMDPQQQLSTISSQSLPQQPEVIEVGPPTFYTMDSIPLLTGTDKAGGLEPQVIITSQPSSTSSKSLLQGESLLSGGIKPLAMPQTSQVSALAEEGGLEGIVSGAQEGQGGQLDPQTGLFYSFTAPATTTLSASSLLHAHGSIITSTPITVTRIPSLSSVEGRGGLRLPSHTVTVGSGTGAVRAVAHPLASVSVPTTLPTPTTAMEVDTQPELQGTRVSLPVSSGQAVDLLSSSLAEAGVVLGGFDTGEEVLPMFPQQSEASTLPPTSTSLPPTSAAQLPDPAVSAGDDESVDLAEFMVPEEALTETCVETTVVDSSESAEKMEVSQDSQVPAASLEVSMEEELLEVEEPAGGEEQEGGQVQSSQPGVPSLPFSLASSTAALTSSSAALASSSAALTSTADLPISTSPAVPPIATSSVQLPMPASAPALLTATSTAELPVSSVSSVLPASTGSDLPSSTSSAEVSMSTSSAELPTSTSSADLPFSTPSAAVSALASLAELPPAVSVALPVSASSTELPVMTSSAELPPAALSAELPIYTASAAVPVLASSAELPASTSSAELPVSASSTEFPTTTSSAEVPTAATSVEIPMATSSELPMPSSSGEFTVPMSSEAVPALTSSAELPASITSTASSVADVLPVSSAAITSTFTPMVPSTTESLQTTATSGAIDSSAKDVTATTMDVIVSTAASVVSTSGGSAGVDNSILTSGDNAIVSSFIATTTDSTPSSTLTTTTTPTTDCPLVTSTPVEARGTAAVSDAPIVEVTSADSSFAPEEGGTVTVEGTLSEEAVFLDMSGMDMGYTEISGMDIPPTSESSLHPVLSTSGESLGVFAASSAVPSTSGNTSCVPVIEAGGVSVPDSSVATTSLTSASVLDTFPGASVAATIGRAGSVPLTLVQARPKASTFIPLESVTRSQAPINIITRVQPATVSPSPSSSQSSSQSSASAMLEAGVVEVLAEMTGFGAGQLAGSEGQPSSVSLLDQPGAMVVSMDTSEAVGEEQQMLGALGMLGESQGDQDLAALRNTKRKRRAPSGLEESPSASSSWVRSALVILQKVSRFRGSNRKAAEWFLQPVDINEVPDYFDFIKTPMDFGTIKKKLESGQYPDIEEFNKDMELVESNCVTYNPPECQVRRDCEEVFAFYRQEWNRLMEKWQKTHTGSPGASKKPRLDKSPSKP